MFQHEPVERIREIEKIIAWGGNRREEMRKRRKDERKEERDGERKGKREGRRKIST